MEVTELSCFQYDLNSIRLGIYASWGETHSGFFVFRKFVFRKDEIIEIKMLSENRLFLRVKNGAYNINFKEIESLLKGYGYIKGENNGK